MSHKIYPFSAEIAASLDLHSFLEFFDMDADTLFCFTPNGIRKAIAADRDLGEALKDAFNEMFKNDKSEGLFERRGFTVSMTNAVWAYKMCEITKGAYFGYVPDYDQDEEGYAAIIAQRKAEFAIKHAAAEAKQEELYRKNLAARAAAERTTVAADMDNFQLEEKGFLLETVAEPLQVLAQKPIDLYLSGLRPGQGEMARMLIGSAAITTAPQNQLRRYWTEKSMRLIERVSGYKAGSIAIKYYGEELRLNDIEVWMKIMKLAADQPLGTEVTFNTRQFARAMGKGIGTNTLKALKKVLTRLKAATFNIETTCPHFIKNLKFYFPENKAIQNAAEKVEITFNMLSEYADADSGKEFSVTLGRAVRALLGTRVSFWFDEALYESLQGDYAKRLFLLYTSHQNCYPLTRRDIREYFGSSMQSDDDLHAELKKALNQLVEKNVIEKGWEYMNHPVRGMSYVVTKIKLVKEVLV